MITKAEAIKKLIEKRDVRIFNQKFFGVNLTTTQEEIVRTVAFDEHKRVVISCMTRYGKSFCVSLGLLLWIMMNERKRLGIIAPTNEKTSILRNYMSNFITMCPDLMDLLDLDKKGTDRIKKEVSKRRMTWRNGIEMRTLSAEGHGEQLMGFGFDKVVVDETCDIKFEVFRSRITRMLGDSPNATYVEIGNPWHRDNHMWMHWINPNWFKIHVDWKTALKEGRISENFLEEQRNQLTNREFKILYEAEFPEESEDQLIHFSWIRDAIKPFVEISGIKTLGVDVARTGKDSTVLTYGVVSNDFYIVKGIQEHNQEDTMRTVDRILTLHYKEKFNRIIVDTNGLGAGVADRLNQLKRDGQLNCEIIEFFGGRQPGPEIKKITTEKKVVKSRFLNTKAEAYFKLRSIFEEGRIIIPNNPKLIDQLTKMKWILTGNEKIRVLDPGIAKEDTSEEKSPDFADSLCYFCYSGKREVLTFQFLDFKK